jgi:hypothetical protein
MKHPGAELSVASARAPFKEAARLLKIEVSDTSGGMYSCSTLRTALQRFREAEVVLLRIEARRALLGKRET